MKQQVKVLGLIGLMAFGTLNLTACSDEDVAFGAGVVIGAVVADGLGSNNNNSGNHGRDRDHDRGHERDQHSGGGYHPQPLPPRPRPQPGRPGNHYGMSLNSLQLVDSTDASIDEAAQSESVLTLAMVSPEVTATAHHFQISETAAAKVWTALNQAKQGDLQAIEDLGFARQDLIALAQGENPSVTSLQTVSDSLGLEMGETHQVFQQMKSDLSQATVWK